MENITTMTKKAMQFSWGYKDEGILKNCLYTNFPGNIVFFLLHAYFFSFLTEELCKRAPDILVSELVIYLLSKSER